MWENTSSHPTTPRLHRDRDRTCPRANRSGDAKHADRGRKEPLLLWELRVFWPKRQSWETSPSQNRNPAPCLRNVTWDHFVIMSGSLKQIARERWGPFMTQRWSCDGELQSRGFCDGPSLHHRIPAVIGLSCESPGGWWGMGAGRQRREALPH